MVPALAFNSIIVATSAWRGKWNRHAVVPSVIFFTQVPFLNFCKKMQKMKIDYVHCPMRKFWRTSLRPFGQNNVGSQRNEIPGEGCTSLPRVKPGWSFVCLPCTCSWGAPRVKIGSFMAIRMRIHQKLSSFMTPSWTLKKKKKLGP